MFIERESHPYIPWIGLDAKGGERTVAAQRMEVSNADKAGLYYRFLPRYVWSNLFEPKQEHP